MDQQSLVKTHVLEWKITIPREDLSPVTSPEFFLFGSEWRLEIRFEVTSSNYFYNIYLCKVNKEKILSEEPLEKSFRVITFIKLQNYELSNRLEKLIANSKELLGYYSSNTLKTAGVDIKTLEIFCIFQLPVTASIHQRKFSSTRDKCIQAHFDVPCNLESLSLDLCSLLKNEASSSDILVRCGDFSHHAHKAVLEARSEVFAAMFRNKMAESETGVVEIADMDGTDFELFLKFVYSGKIEIPSEDSATSLYAAGDKYAILSLKKACSDYLVKNLNPENCLRFLEISERHGDKTFMAAAVNFVAENLDGLDREEWSSFKAQSPKLTMKVYEKRLKGTLSKQVSFKKMKCME